MPANSYKKENSDLKPDDRPWISILTKKGNYIQYQLSVIDRITSLYQFRAKHMNDTRYPEFKANKKAAMEYTTPHIRIEKIFPVNLIEEHMKTNKTINFTQSQWEDFTLNHAEFVHIKGKKFLMAMDSNGNLTYFATRTAKQFVYYGTFATGAEGINEVKQVRMLGSNGMFLVFNNHFSYAMHMNKNWNSHNVCIPGFSVHNYTQGLKMVEVDNGIPVVYAISE